MNAHGWNVYVRVNAYRPGRSRARDAVAQCGTCSSKRTRRPSAARGLVDPPDLPPPSYVLHSSRSAPPAVARAGHRALTNRATAEAAGSRARDRSRRHVVRAGHEVAGPLQSQATAIGRVGMGTCTGGRLHAERLPGGAVPPARRREAATVDPPRPGGAGAGISPPRRSGDRRTARGSADLSVCCRIVRGFALGRGGDELLAAWNARCEPPWSEQELRQKVTTGAALRAGASGRAPVRSSHTCARMSYMIIFAFLLTLAAWMYTQRIPSLRMRPPGRASHPCSPASLGPARTSHSPRSPVHGGLGGSMSKSKARSCVRVDHPERAGRSRREAGRRGGDV